MKCESERLQVNKIWPTLDNSERSQELFTKSNSFNQAISTSLKGTDHQTDTYPFDRELVASMASRQGIQNEKDAKSIE